jgi:hypothetical protein
MALCTGLSFLLVGTVICGLLALYMILLGRDLENGGFTGSFIAEYYCLMLSPDWFAFLPALLFNPVLLFRGLRTKPQ